MLLRHFKCQGCVTRAFRPYSKKKKKPGNHVMQYTPTAKRTLVPSPDRDEERDWGSNLLWLSLSCFSWHNGFSCCLCVCVSLSVCLCVCLLCTYRNISGMCHHVVISSWFSSPNPVDFCLLRNGSRPLQADITSHVTAHFTHARLWSELHVPPFSANHVALTGSRSL